MGSAFRSFVRSRPDSLTISAIEEFIAAQRLAEQEASARARPFVLPVLGCLVVGIGCVAASAFAEASQRIWFDAASAIGWLGFIVVGSVALISGLNSADQEIATATYVLKRRDDQPATLARALQLAATAPGAALFLRSFNVEDSGASEEEIQRNLDYVGNYEANFRAQTDGLYSGLPADFEDLTLGRNVWTDQIAAIRKLQSHLPVVMLENITTDASKRGELEAAGVVVIPVLIGDWWDVFVQLSRVCRLSVFFADDRSPELRREMLHTARAAEHPFAVMRSSPAAEVDLELKPVMERCSLTIAHDDLAGLDGWLVEQMKLPPPAATTGVSE